MPVQHSIKIVSFNQEKALVGAFSVITNLRMDLFEALVPTACAAELIIAGPDHTTGFALLLITDYRRIEQLRP